MIRLFGRSVAKCWLALVATLFAATGFAEVDVAQVLSEAALHLDASKPESFVLNESGGVTSWINQSAAGRELYGDAKAGGTKYGTRTTKSWKGWDVPVYDTGAQKSDIYLVFSPITDVQTAFWVGDIDKRTKDYAAPLLSNNDGAIVRNKADGAFVSAQYGAMLKKPDQAHLAFYLNSKTSGGNGTTMTPNTGSIDLIAMTCDSNDFAFDQLAKDGTNASRSGGFKFCEVIVFTKALTTDEFNAVYDYLDEKWNNGGWAVGVGTRTWTGQAADGKWASSGNWDTGVPAAADTVVFANETDVSTVYDIENGITSLEKSGAGILTIKDFAAGSPTFNLTGGGIVLTGTVPAANPFSSALDNLHLNGLVDLGGATQTLYVTPGDSMTGEKWLPAGEKIIVTNGTLTIKTPSDNYSNFKGELIALAGGTITHTAKLNLQMASGAPRILADSGTFNYTMNNAAYVGVNGSAVATGIVEVVNGGHFYAQKDFTFGSGLSVGKLLIASGGTADFGTANVKMGETTGSAVLRIENGTLKLGTLSVLSANATVDAAFDGATVVATAAKSPFVSSALAQSPFEILSGGLTLDNGGYNIGIAAPFGGEGGVTLAGAGRTTFTAAQTFTGDLTVGGGTTLVLKHGTSTFSGNVVFAPGAKLDLEFDNDGISTLTAQSVDFSALTAEQPMILTLTLSDSPDAGVNYRVFATQEGTMTQEDLKKIVLPVGMVGVIENGILSIRINPKTTTWTGAAGDGKWSTDGNWSNGRPASYDSVVFNSAASESTDDLSGLMLDNITFGADAGAFTLGGTGSLTVLTSISNLSANVQSFAMPVAGSTLFSDLYTAADGGLAFTGGFTGGIVAFRKTGEGTVTMKGQTPKCPFDLTEGSLFLADLEKDYRTNPFSSTKDQLHLNGLVDLGGATQTFNATPGSWLPAGEKIIVTNGTFTIAIGTGTYSNFDGELIALKGGTINHNARLNLQQTGGAPRILVDGGTFNHTGNNGAYVGSGSENACATGIVEVVNGGRFNAQRAFTFGERTGNVGMLLVSSGGTADFGTSTVKMGNTAGSTGVIHVENGTLRLGTLSCPNAGAIVDALFDGATVAAAADTADILSSAHTESPYVVGEGGLVVSNDGHTVGFKTALRGIGTVTLAGTGTDTGRFTFAEGYTFPADVVIDGAKVVASPTEQVRWYRVFSARGEIRGYPEGKDAYGNKYYVTSNGGVNTLMFGIRPPLVIMVK